MVNLILCLIAFDPLPMLPTPTAGGLQLWTDHRIRDGYRVQENSITGNWRMIDAAGIRRASGDQSYCINAIEMSRPWTADDDDGRTVTVLIHGLMRTRHCMRSLATRIQHADGHAIAFGYSSTRNEVPTHAAALAEVIADWPPSWRLRFVGHSMGNIVTRHWVGDRIAAGDDAILGRCESMVMLGPPNQGSSIARRLEPTRVFGWVAGRGGLQMGPTFDGIVDGLATPPFPFAIIAGDVTHYPIGNPLIAAPNDLLVTVAETKLAGMAAHEVFPVPHAKLMDTDSVMSRVTVLLNDLAPTRMK